MYAKSTCKYSASNLLSCNTCNWKNYKLYNGNVPNIRHFTHKSMYWCWSLTHGLCITAHMVNSFFGNAIQMWNALYTHTAFTA